MWLIYKLVKKNKNAVFQIASNFNCVETPNSGSRLTEDPNFTQNYIFDYTQGPGASVSAGPAAIVRVHAIFFDNDMKNVKQWKQRKEKQINLLSELDKYFVLQNGYVILADDKEDDNERWLKEEEWKRKVMVGYHKDVQVTFGSRNKSDGTIELVNDDKQIIDQVFCAALNIGKDNTGYKNSQKKSAERKGKFILQSMYEGTYLSAIKNSKKKLFLTLIGGGVFENKREWIIEAIINAHKKWADCPASTLENIYLVFYSGFDSVILKELSEKKYGGSGQNLYKTKK